MYDLLLDDEAADAVSDLPKDLQTRIYSKLDSARENPHRFFERLRGRTDFKMRIGSYRVIADIDDLFKRIEVTRIGHRKNIYEKI